MKRANTLLDGDQALREIALSLLIGPLLSCGSLKLGLENNCGVQSNPEVHHRKSTAIPPIQKKT